MRDLLKSGGVTVNAIAGTHVVTLGLDLDEAARQGCLGFAIQREDRTDGGTAWMEGMKTFAETDPKLGPGGQVSSRDHPFQTFQWADYTAKPEHDYTYTVVPLHGTPQALTEGPHVAVKITTEPTHATEDSPHTVFFNRGSVASQEYARRFHDKKPNKLLGAERKEAYEWLSRGLLEALLEFIARAEDKDWGLHGAIYEFQWKPVLEALGEAHARGADVSVLYDDIAGGPGPKNERAIGETAIGALTLKRTQGKIMHNKFLVLTHKGKPVAVWTGSTNITENGIFGHLNCGHAVEDPALAASYLQYLAELCEDRRREVEQQWLDANNLNPPQPPDPWQSDLVTIFSPHSKLDALDWYATAVAGKADARALFMTFAFGMDKRFKAVYERDDDVLRFALMDKAGSGPHKAVEEAEIEAIRKRPNVVVAIGNRIELNAFDHWLAESPGLTQGVQWVHTKFMLVDPLSEQPVVVTGSANFSEPSTDENNENMLVIRGDTRVADIYLGEYMRLYSHYAFREAVARKWGGQTWNPGHLDSTEGWSKDYFVKGTERDSRRRYFAQSDS
jgi:phosphatidylserine/phosphatidylglycerophosphate/cardiolipin synthase-like enzyme